MALEEYFDPKRIRIQNLSEMPKKEKPNARRLFEDLKRTALYDMSRKQWNAGIKENQEIYNSARKTSDQLLDVLVESVFDKTSARRKFEDLKRTALFDRERNQWGHVMNEDQELKDDERYSFDQLLGVIVESRFDMDASREHHEELKGTPLFDRRERKWLGSITKEQKLQNTFAYFHAQLIGIIAESNNDKEAAKQIYERLKWDVPRMSDSQLLDILTLSVFDKRLAKARFEELKQTALFDKEKKQWIVSIDENGQPMGNERDAESQLLGIYLEHILGETEDAIFDEKPNVPLIRNF